MLKSVTLQNFKSFGEKREVPLQPITVLVGPNNSGKSNFLSVARLVRNAVLTSGTDAIQQEGGVTAMHHSRSPRFGPTYDPARDSVQIGWSTDAGSYSTTLEDIRPASERFDEKELINVATGSVIFGSWVLDRSPFAGLRAACIHRKDIPTATSTALAMVGSRSLHLTREAMRADSEVVPDPKLGADGSGIASVLALWRGAYPERAVRLEEFVRRCAPEVRNVLVKPSPTPGWQRLWLQIDDAQFEASRVSDGLLMFIAIAMNLFDAEDSSLITIEEPETSVHPRRLAELLDLVRAVVTERGCQVVLSTHSPVLLNELRDEPESILVFRRSAEGSTEVDPLTSFPHLMDALDGEGDRRASPGEMLTDGFLSEPR